MIFSKMALVVTTLTISVAASADFTEDCETASLLADPTYKIFIMSGNSVDMQKAGQNYNKKCTCLKEKVKTSASPSASEIYLKVIEYQGRVSGISSSERLHAIRDINACENLAEKKPPAKVQHKDQPIKMPPQNEDIINTGRDFDDLIRSRAAEGWSRPPGAVKGMRVVLQINMLPDSTMNNITVLTSSGYSPFYESVIAALKNIGRLSEMSKMSAEEYEVYRSFKMTFTPEDLAL